MPKRKDYRFSITSESVYKHVYSVDNYSNPSLYITSTLEEESNSIILFELLLIDLFGYELAFEFFDCRKIHYDSIDNKLEFMHWMFNFVVDGIVRLLGENYFLLYDQALTKKQLWNDIQYKLLFNHVHPEMGDHDFANPYEDSDELIF